MAKLLFRRVDLTIVRLFFGAAAQKLGRMAMSNGMAEVSGSLATPLTHDSSDFASLVAASRELTTHWHTLASGGAHGDEELLRLSREAVERTNASAVGGTYTVAMARAHPLAALLWLLHRG